MCSTVEGVQYEGGTPSIRSGCAVQISHIISTDEGVHYRTTKTAQGVVGTYLGKYFTDNLKVCSINFEPPDNDLFSPCHVYPLSRGAWIISILFILNRFIWGLNYII